MAIMPFLKSLHCFALPPSPILYAWFSIFSVAVADVCKMHKWLCCQNALATGCPAYFALHSHPQLIHLSEDSLYTFVLLYGTGPCREMEQLSVLMRIHFFISLASLYELILRACIARIISLLCCRPLVYHVRNISLSYSKSQFVALLVPTESICVLW